VAALGPGVDWPEVDTRMGARFLHHSDGHCNFCVRGDQILCLNKEITGISVPGRYAEYSIGVEHLVTARSLAFQNQDGFDRLEPLEPRTAALRGSLSPDGWTRRDPTFTDRDLADRVASFGGPESLTGEVWTLGSLPTPRPDSNRGRARGRARGADLGQADIAVAVLAGGRSPPTRKE
jgi:hypothetical protein